MKRRRSNTLVALSSAAVMTVYAAGFMRTRAAAERLEHASRERPPALPVAAPVDAPAAAPVAAPAMAPAAAPVLPVVESKVVRPTVVAKAPAATLTPTIPHASAVESKPAASELKPAAHKPSDADALGPAETGAATTPVPDASAAPSVAPPTAPPPSPSAEMLIGSELRDGTFLGWGSSRHGDIQASVTILSGRITAVSIAQCRTRYSCDVIAHLPGTVLKDQTPEKINNVSGATQSVDAFYYAVVDAISKAK